MGFSTGAPRPDLYREWPPERLPAGRWFSQSVLPASSAIGPSLALLVGSPSWGGGPPLVLPAGSPSWFSEWPLRLYRWVSHWFSQLEWPAECTTAGSPSWFSLLVLPVASPCRCWGSLCSGLIVCNAQPAGSILHAPSFVARLLGWSAPAVMWTRFALTWSPSASASTCTPPDQVTTRQGLASCPMAPRLCPD